MTTTNKFPVSVDPYIKRQTNALGSAMPILDGHHANSTKMVLFCVHFNALLSVLRKLAVDSSYRQMVCCRGTPNFLAGDARPGGRFLQAEVLCQKFWLLVITHFTKIALDFFFSSVYRRFSLHYICCLMYSLRSGHLGVVQLTTASVHLHQQ
jgi:hypothetical protein